MILVTYLANQKRIKSYFVGATDFVIVYVQSRIYLTIFFEFYCVERSELGIGWLMIQTVEKCRYDTRT